MTGVRSGSRTGSGRTNLPRTVRLCAVVGVDEGELRRSGATLSDGVWTVCVDDGFDLAALARWLPRSVGGTAGGEHCGHVLDRHASDLSHSLCPSSWRVLAEVTCLRTAACVECGDEPGGSAAPSWRWDSGPDAVVGVLVSIRALCGDCHRSSRPEGSSWRWPAARRQARLAAILGTDVSAVAASIAEHSRMMASWGDAPMALDMSVLSGLGLSFRKGWTHEEDVLSWDGGSVRVSGASLSTARGMVLIA